MPKKQVKTLSELIEDTIAGARKLNRRKYVPHAHCWHEMEYRDGVKRGGHLRCRVCLGGAYVASALRIDINEEHPLRKISTRDNVLVDALNMVRMGHWAGAYCTFHNKDFAEDLYHKLNCLPEPEHHKFKSWKEFDKHLKSLESILPSLKEIEVSVTETRS